MVPKMLQLKCAGHGPNVTSADERKAAAVVIGGTLAMVIPLMLVMVRYGSNPYLQSLLSVSWLVPVSFSQHYTSLKGRSGRVQAVLIGGPAAFVMVIALATAWFSSN